MNEADPICRSMLQAFDEQPFSKMRRGVLADYLEEYGGELGAEKAAILRNGDVPMTDFARNAALALGGCSFAPATWDKRFARDIYSRVHAAVLGGKVPSLTTKQYLWMVILLWRYRRTADKCYVKWAEKHYNRAVELLDIAHLKPLDRHLSGKRKGHTDTRTFLFDEVP